MPSGPSLSAVRAPTKGGKALQLPVEDSTFHTGGSLLEHPHTLVLGTLERKPQLENCSSPQWLCDPQNCAQSLGAGTEHPDGWRNTKGAELGELVDPREELGSSAMDGTQESKRSCSCRAPFPAESQGMLAWSWLPPGTKALPRPSQLTLFFHYSRTQLVSLSKSPAKVAGI